MLQAHVTRNAVRLLSETLRVSGHTDFGGNAHTATLSLNVLEVSGLTRAVNSLAAVVEALAGCPGASAQAPPLAQDPELYDPSDACEGRYAAALEEHTAAMYAATFDAHYLVALSDSAG